MNKVFLTAVAVASMLMLSCTKQIKDYPKDSVGPDIKNALLSQSAQNGVPENCTDPDPRNPDNSWDSVGIYHNSTLEYVRQQTAGQTKTLSGNVYYSNEYITSTFGPRVSNISSKLFSSSAICSLLADSSNGYSTVIDNSNYSKKVKDRFKNLIALLQDTASLVSVDYCTIKSLVVSFESDVINDITLSTTEKDQVLRVTSVARHSLYYWYLNYNSTLTGGESLSTQKRKWWQWLVIGVADVAGGIAGGITTGPTVLGTVSGVIAGAAGASSGAATIVD